MPTPIDTSGYVLTTSQFPPPGDGALKLRWRDLDAFTQGYIEALLGQFNAGYFPVDGGQGLHRFRDLAPETLALILRDCAWYQSGIARRDAADAGRCFWRDRNCGDLTVPPLTPTLADDGFVYLREGQ